MTHLLYTTNPLSTHTSLVHDVSKIMVAVAEIVITIFSASSVTNNSSPIDVNLLKSIRCTFIIISTSFDSNFLLFIFFKPFYRVMIIFFDHKNGGNLSLWFCTYSTHQHNCLIVCTNSFSLLLAYLQLAIIKIL